MGIVVSLLLIACGGGTTVPSQDEDSPATPAPPDRITAEALHGCSLDDVAMSELATAVSIEFRQYAKPGKFVRLSFPEGLWPDPAGIEWTIRPNDRTEVATAIAVAKSSVDIGIIASDGANPGPTAVTIKLAGTPPEEASPGPPALTATAELLSVIDLGDERVKLDWIQALPGDFDFNGRVELADLAVLANHLGDVVDLGSGVEPDSAAYWLDSNHDGLISPEDGSAVSENLSAEVAGYVIAASSTEIDPDAPGTISVSTERADSAGGAPPAYSVELAGSADTDWSVAAVDSAGRVGNPRRPVLRRYDLVATINLIGMELFKFPELGDQGRRPGKIGTRVIEPIDVVNRGTISTPLISDDSTFKFAGLPRDRELLLDINYVPKQSLDSGQPVQLEVGPVDSLSLVEEAAATAIPFNLSGAGGTGQLNIDIFFMPNPLGGYWIEVIATSFMPGDELPAFRHTLLDYSEGVLSVDANGDDQFELGWYFTDGDRDNVSDSWIEQNEQLEQFGYVPTTYYMIEGSVLAVNQPDSTVRLADIEWVDSPVLGDPFVLNYSEETLIVAPGESGAPLMTPAELEAGARVSAMFYMLRDPSGKLPDSHWLDQLILLEDGGQ
jgi:hypothetical protein